MKLLAFGILASASVLLGACDDSSTGTGGASSTSGSTSTVTSGATTANVTSNATTTTATTGAGTGTGTGGAAPVEAAAFIRGDLFTTDIAAAKSKHDMLATQGQAQFLAAGDIAHDPLLGTTHLGTKQNQFVAIDRWSSDTNMDAAYGDPNFQQALGQLFSAPPEFETFLKTDFYGWGSLDSADATSPHYFIVIRGHFADSLQNTKAQHDAIAMGGETQAQQLGDVAHVVYSGRQDPREALIVDVWPTDTNIDAFYGNPQFQAAVAALFNPPPSFGVYSSTDWHSW